MMGTGPTVRRVSRPLSVAVLLTIAGPAYADDRNSCASAAEEAQTLRSESHLALARTKLLNCVRETCPAIVRKDCVQWLAQLDATMPTIVVRAQDDLGHDKFDVRVVIDGVLAQEQLTGTPFPLDPGAHEFKFIAQSGRIVEERALIVVGERDRLINVRFPVEKEKPLPPPERVVVPPPPAAPPAKSSPSPLMWIGAPIMVIGLGGFVGLGLSGLGDYHDLQSSPCAATRTCDVGGVRTKLTAAWVSLGVGVVGAGMTLWGVLDRKTAAAPSSGSTRIDLRPVRGGAIAGVERTF